MLKSEAGDAARDTPPGNPDIIEGMVELRSSEHPCILSTLKASRHPD
jgi:hypothetical protein